MKQHHPNFPQQYIKDAIQNKLLFQQNNPLISQSMSLLNSRMKKSFDSQLHQLTSKQLTNQSNIRKLYIQKQKQKSYKSQSQQYQQNDHCEQDNYNDQIQNQRAIQQFQRQIQEKYKISVSNQLYTFPKLKIKSIIDIISSSQSQDDQQPTSQPSTSQQNSNQHNPFDPVHYNKKIKTQYFPDQEISEKSNQDDLHIRNFKKVKNTNIKISDDTKKNNHKFKKNQSLKKDQFQNYSHRQKVKTTKKNPQVTIKQRTIKNKQTIKQQKQPISQHHQKQQWAIKQPKHNNQRLKTQMYNDSSRLSESITDSKRKCYNEQFFTKK